MTWKTWKRPSRGRANRLPISAMFLVSRVSPVFRVSRVFPVFPVSAVFDAVDPWRLLRFFSPECLSPSSSSPLAWAPVTAA
jgi:hypothetical protein